jgi:alkylated DNA nucleotide flippase Atl1
MSSSGSDHQRGHEVLRRIRTIPHGRVSTYGDIWPGAPRFVGNVLAHSDDPTVPWQRVVRADGSLARGERQRAALEAEGVAFVGDKVDMGDAHIPGEALGYE